MSSVKKFESLEDLQAKFKAAAARNKAAKANKIITIEEANAFNKELLALRDEFNRAMFTKVQWVKQGDLLILSANTLIPTTFEKLLKNKNFELIDNGHGFEFRYKISDELAKKQTEFSYNEISRVVVFQKTSLIHSLLMLDGYDNIELKKLLGIKPADELRVDLKKQIFKKYDKVALCSTSFNNRKLLENGLLRVFKIAPNTPEYAAVISHLQATTPAIDGHITVEDMQEETKYVPSEPEVKRYETAPEFESFDELKVPMKPIELTPEIETEIDAQQDGMEMVMSVEEIELTTQKVGRKRTTKAAEKSGTTKEKVPKKQKV